MMNIEELRKIFCEDGLYAVCVENGNLVSHYRIMCYRYKHRQHIMCRLKYRIYRQTFLYDSFRPHTYALLRHKTVFRIFQAHRRL